MPLDAGSVFVRLFAKSDARGFEEHEALIKRAQAHAAIKTELGADVRTTDFKLYEQHLAKARALADAQKSFKAHLGVDYDSKAFAAFARDLRRSSEEIKRNHQTVFGLGLAYKSLNVAASTLPHQMRGIAQALIGVSQKIADIGVKIGAAVGEAAVSVLKLSEAFPKLAGSVAGALGGVLGLSGGLAGIALVGGTVASTVISLVGALAALASSLAAAVAGVGALGIGLAAVAGPFAALGALVVSRFSKISDAYKALSNEQDKGAATARTHAKAVRSAADAQQNAARQIKDAQRSLSDARRQGADQINSAEQSLADTRRQSTERIKTAEQSLVDARRTGAQAVSGAERNLADVRQRGAESVAQAEKQLADAQDSEKRAQEDLTKAHQDARREYEDLRTAITDAKLAEEGSVLSYQEAIKKLTETRLDPKATALDIAEAQHQVKVAAQGVTEARTQTRRANEDAARGTDTLTKAREALTEANKGVAEATQNLADVSKQAGQDQKDALVSLRQAQVDSSKRIKAAVKDLTAAQLQGARDNTRAQQAVQKAQEDAARSNVRAQENVKRAQQDAAKAIRDAKDSLKDQGSTADTAAAKLAKLSKAERALLTTVRDFSKEVGRSFLPATDAIFSSLDGALKKLKPSILGFQGDFKRLGEAIGREIGDAADSLSGPRWQSALHKFVKTAEDITHPLGQALGSVVVILRNTAVATLPYIRDLAGWLDKTLGHLADQSNNADRMDRLIKNLLEHTRAWVQFMGATGRLLLDLFRTGSGAGKDLLGDLTHIFNRWSDWLETDAGQRRMRKFFSDSVKWSEGFVEAIGKIFTVFRNLGLFVQSHQSIFSSFFKGVDLALGAIVKIINKVPALGEALGGLAVIGGLAKILGLTSAVRVLDRVITMFGTLKKAAVEAAEAEAVADALAGGGVSVGGKRIPVPGKPHITPKTGAGGIAGAAEGAAGGAAGAGIIQGVKALAKGYGPKLAKGGAIGAAVAFAVELVDSKGNAIAAAINAAHDLTFGLTPRVKERKVKIEGEIHIPGVKDVPGLKNYEDQIKRLIGKKDWSGLEKLSSVLRSNADEARKWGDQKLASQYDHLADRTVALSQTTSGEFGKVRSELDKARAKFLDLRRYGNNDLDSIMKVTKENMASIRHHLGQDTADGKEALARNFRAARKAIQDSMDQGRTSVEDGLREIRSLMRKELAAYGVTGKVASSIIKHGNIKGSDAPQAGHAVGGWIGARGRAGQDTVPIWVGAGEAVLNRHQQGVIEGLLGDGFLDTLFTSVKTPHYMAKGGFAQGGLAGARSAADKLEQAHFPYKWGGGHQASPAPFGPMDCSGAVSYVLQRAGVDIPTSTSGMLAHRGLPGSGLLTVFANPEHTFMKIGNLGYFGTSGTNPGGGAGWFPEPGAGYRSRFAVRHFGGRAGFLGGAGEVAPIQPPQTGVSGALGAIVQRAINTAAAGGTMAVGDAVARMGLNTGNTGDPGPSASPGSQAQARRWIASGLRLAKLPASARNVATLLRQAISESGLDPHAQNNWDSNAKAGHPSKGFLQTIDSTFQRYKVRGHNNIWNPVDNTAAAARYMMATYGHLIGTASGYARGGYVGQKPSGPARAAGGGRAHPIKRWGGGGGGGGGTFSVGKLQNLQTTRIAEYDQIQQAIEDQEKVYSRQERVYNMTDEVLIDPESGNVNAGAVQARAAELTELIRIRQYILSLYQRMRAIAARILQTYQTILNRLSASLLRLYSGSRKTAGQRTKDRAGIRAQMETYQADMGKYAEQIHDLDTNFIPDTSLDVQELVAERAEILATAPIPQDLAQASIDTSAASSTDDTLQSMVDQAGRINTMLTAQLKTATSSLAAFTSPGDIGGGSQGGTALGAAMANAADASAPLTGGKLSVAGQVLPAGAISPTGAGPMVTVNVNTLGPLNQNQLQQVGDTVLTAFQQRTVVPVTSMKVG